MNRYGFVKNVFETPETETAARLTGCRNILEAEVIDDHTLTVKGWGTQLQTSWRLERKHNMVGIRAHYFQKVTQPGKNVIAGAVETIVDGPFEHILYIRPKEGDEILCWKTGDQLSQ